MRNLHTRRGGAAIPRVCLLTETLHPVVGGGETHARLLAGRLNWMDMRTFVLTRRTSRELPVAETIEGIPVHRVPPSGMKRWGKYAMAPFVLRELIRLRDDYDVILVCGFRVLGVPAMLASRLLGKACVLRAETVGETSGSYASAYRRLPTAMDRAFRSWIAVRNRVLCRADAFVSISTPISEEWLRAGIERSRIHRIPNGIDTSVFRPADAQTRRSLRTRLGLPADGFVAAYSGKLNKGKGLEYLIQAWSEIARPDSRAHLVLIGSGGGQSLSCEYEIRSKVSALGLQDRVTFTGYVGNVHEYLRASDAFVLPSENEALPLSLIEAMSCGLPAITTSVGGIPEIVTHEENGLLVAPRDPESLAGEITRLISEPSLARRLAENGRRTACERYSIDEVASRYFELLTDVYASRSREGAELA